MKIIKVYLRDDFLQENTRRVIFRNFKTDDFWVNTKKAIAGVVPLVLGGYAIGKMMMLQGMEATNAGFRILHTMHNGITHIGSDPEGVFHLDAIDTEQQKNLNKKYHLKSPALSSNIQAYYLVTDDDEAAKDKVTKGVIFYSKKEAVLFSEMYSSLEDFIDSKFYQADELLLLQITEDDLEVFQKELEIFLKKYNGSFMVTDTNLKRKLHSRHFMEYQVVHPQDPDKEFIAPNGSPIIEIVFPKEINQADLKNFFSSSLQANQKLKSELEAALHEEQRARIEAKEDVADILEIYGSDSEGEDDDSSLEKGKEKVVEDDEISVETTFPTQADAEKKIKQFLEADKKSVKIEADTNLTKFSSKPSLVKKMGKGIYQSEADKEEYEEEGTKHPKIK